ncbi:MAG TPA: flagellar basal body rod protein FlgC [Candidatus Hydrogenedentes bacterium]|nr:flagellar basal body rod protein FlgC [Candidatus Hydrogenedentota bacterium]HQE83913.1 flagellar basal body rod protein FlgC [Candidatus Hydrogenedentota bacterium]HQH50855.1 flagellar basal body rod protein FlgC [Candidatus Hydrogenedentota bacterium]HQM50598.1 flagellar basal body rod protein FlgC [Candidatus Hydrogenedentota bacterium]
MAYGAMLDGISATDIAVSGLKTQRTRMNVIANNIANALTTRTARGGAFRRQLAIVRGEQLQPAINPDKFGVNVKSIKTDYSPLRQVYEPGHPDADANGYVNYPNVDVSVEMVNLVAAQRAYDANVAVVVSDKRMRQKALEILQA